MTSAMLIAAMLATLPIDGAEVEGAQVDGAEVDGAGVEGAEAPAAPPIVVPAANTSTVIEPAPSIDDIVAMQTDRYRRMTVPVTVDGEGPFRFMVDTGAQATVVTRGLTERLDLIPIGSALIIGMGSSKRAAMFELNGLEFAQRTFNAIEAPMLEANNIGADGILGLDSLQNLRVLIDFRSNTLAVNDAEELGGDTGYEIIVRARRKVGRLIITDAKIDGIRTTVVLDTGAQSSFGNAQLKRRLRARRAGKLSLQDVNGAVVMGDRHIAKLLQIQALRIAGLSVTFADTPVFAALKLDKRPALILGMRDLRAFDRVAIDFAKRKVLFDLPRGVGSRFPR